jgi:hypothetical protein
MRETGVPWAISFSYSRRRLCPCPTTPPARPLDPLLADARMLVRRSSGRTSAAREGTFR